MYDVWREEIEWCGSCMTCNKWHKKNGIIDLVWTGYKHYFGERWFCNQKCKKEWEEETFLYFDNNKQLSYCYYFYRPDANK